MTNQDFQPAVLVYDGMCEFCAYWVRYWERLTGKTIQYEKYQDVSSHYPAISIEEFSRSIQLIFPNGQRFSGANAAFRVLSQVQEKRIWLWLYNRLPGFAWFAERCYDLTAGHRIAAAKVSRMLWGKELYPANYHLVSWLFLRLFAIIYFSAFASMAVQIEGLIGANGILPIGTRLAVIEHAVGNEKFWFVPTVFWFDASDNALNAVCIAGMVAAVLVLLNILPRIALVVCFVLYLSLVHAGQNFMTFQWDTFLLEAGVLAVFLVSGSRIMVFLYRWLLFRFMFMSGVVKLASGDPTWANLTALSYHYETQPLPTPFAWYVHHFPEWFHQISVGGVFFMELIVPFLMFMPRCPRMFAAWSTIALQCVIIITGNYNFFNLLTILLCLFLFEDRDLSKLMPGKLIRFIEGRKTSPSKSASATAGLLATLIFLTCGTYLWIQNSRQPPIEPFATLIQATLTFSLVNNYGLFSIMTTHRPEIIVEGSNDGTVWHAYGFKYKPDSYRRNLSWNIPHQPRLDWQMWFAALKPAHKHSWVARFLGRLKEGSPEVLALLAYNPFPDKPPNYVRAALYHYTYTAPKVRAATGDVWKRKYLGTYWPLSQLR